MKRLPQVVLVASLVACTPKKEIRPELQDAGPTVPPLACRALNNEATDVMLRRSDRDAGADETRAVQAYEKACPQCAVSCANLALALLGGRGVAKDVPRGLGLYATACEGGDFEACVALGTSYDRGDDVAIDKSRAESLYRKACDAGSGLGCSNLGALLDRKGRRSAEADVRRLWEKGCDLKSREACANLALLVEEQGDTAQAKNLYDSACDAGELSACFNVRDMLEGSPSRRTTSMVAPGWRRIE